MSKLLSLSAALVLAGCAHSGTPKEAPAPQRPEGMFKVLETPELGTYFAANSLALYQNNPNLRQFYLVNNYAKPAQLGGGKPPIYSSRATRVINCEKDESAQFGRVYFSAPFAQGWRSCARKILRSGLHSLVSRCSGSCATWPAPSTRPGSSWLRPRVAEGVSQAGCSARPGHDQFGLAGIGVDAVVDHLETLLAVKADARQVGGIHRQFQA